MFGELGKQAYEALKHNRRRSFLTMLGMAWGIATVVLLLAYGSGFERGLMVAFSTFGGNMIAIFPGRTSLQAGGTKAGAEVKLTIQDLENLRAEVPFLKRSSPEMNKETPVAYGTRSGIYNIRGTYAGYQFIRHVEVATGSFFTEQEDFTHSRVAVIGYSVKKKLFSGQNAMGESIRIGGISYQVIGVITHMISNGDDDMNSMIYIPYSAMSDLTNTYYLNAILLSYEGEHAKVTKAVATRWHTITGLVQERTGCLRLRRGSGVRRTTDHHHRNKSIARLHRPADFRHRRCGPDEHHAGVGNAAHPRDRRREGARRSPLAHPVSIPGGIAGHHLHCGLAGVALHT